MFDSLNEGIRHREEAGETMATRWFRHAAAFVVSLFAFGSLYVGITLFQ